jgi:hypothetical protein
VHDAGPRLAGEAGVHELVGLRVAGDNQAAQVLAAGGDRRDQRTGEQDRTLRHRSALISTETRRPTKNARCAEGTSAHWNVTADGLHLEDVTADLHAASQTCGSSTSRSMIAGAGAYGGQWFAASHCSSRSIHSRFVFVATSSISAVKRKIVTGCGRVFSTATMYASAGQP